MKTIRILWFSRHKMTEPQLLDLKRIYGQDVEIVQQSLTATKASEVFDLGSNEKCDVYAVVLPPAMLADLLNLTKKVDKPLIIAKNKRVLTGVIDDKTGEEISEFVFDGWEQIENIEIKSKRL